MRRARPVRAGRLSVLRLHRPGTAPLRVLLVADATSLDDLGGAVEIGEATADRLPAASGVDLDVAWDADAVLSTIDASADTWRLWRSEIVVLLHPGGDAVRQDPLFERTLHAVAAASTLLVLPPDALLDQPPPSRRANAARATPTGQATAEALAARIVQVRSTGSSRPVLGRPDDEGERQHALDQLRLPVEQLGAKLDALVDMARNAFDSRYAAVNMLDGTELWTVAAAGVPTGRQPRHAVLCNQTIQRTGLNIIPDTWSDPEAHRLPVTRGTDAVRFYAAHPIESADGYRIGTFCVWDDRPKQTEQFDFSLLRDLALLTEGEIIHADRGRRPS